MVRIDVPAGVGACVNGSWTTNLKTSTVQKSLDSPTVFFYLIKMLFVLDFTILYICCKYVFFDVFFLQNGYMKNIAIIVMKLASNAYTDRKIRQNGFSNTKIVFILIPSNYFEFYHYTTTKFVTHHI